MANVALALAVLGIQVNEDITLGPYTRIPYPVLSYSPSCKGTSTWQRINTATARSQTL
jgi:hypothetical protein